MNKLEWDDFRKQADELLEPLRQMRDMAEAIAAQMKKHHETQLRILAAMEDPLLIYKEPVE